jgi:enoyl-CoA hydratase/carnithine racemase
MTDDAVLYELRGPAAWLTLNRPDKLNALSEAIVAGLHEGMARAEADDSVKLLVLTGAGRAFSAGFDIDQDFGVDGADGWWDVLEKDVAVTMRLRTFPKPTIAAVSGWCLGGACDLAMACDMVVAADDARFGEPEIRFGSGPVTLLMPFVLGQKRTSEIRFGSCPVTMLMPFVIGEKKTNELLYTGEAIDAVEAERIGLVNRVVAGEELEAAVGELVRKIAPTPLAVLRLTKISLLRAYEAMGLQQAVHANLDLSAIINAVDAPETREFNEIARAQGLKAALAWRDSRYGEL